MPFAEILEIISSRSSITLAARNKTDVANNGALVKYRSDENILLE